MARLLLRCYLIRMRGIARLLPLLLIAVASTLPAAARTSMQKAVQIEASASFVQSATPANAKRMAMVCRGCMVKGCGANAIVCSVHCATANALLPLTIALAAITSEAMGPSVSPAGRDHHGPPDPYPPRPIPIS